MTDEKYHNIGIGMDKEKPDIGREEVTKDPKDRGAFKTPTIRNVALSAPYMHDGSRGARWKKWSSGTPRAAIRIRR